MSKRILVVEDDYDILCIVTDLLNDEGYEVAGLSFTASITESVRQSRPDLVILDFLLAGVNGGELCMELKAQPEFANLPVILMSGFPRFLESFGDFGSDGFIAKPFDVNSLLHMVEACLSDKHELV
ncbi:MAG TPA: response regulator [Mucilaginibacter sp.]|jgi:DNA-binding response OmpR family regulator|nr:response regulator [Mucilaginibacter sp.]